MSHEFTGCPYHYTAHRHQQPKKQERGTLTTHAGAPVECAPTLHDDWVLVTGPKSYESILSPRRNLVTCQNVAFASMVILVLARSVSAAVF